VIVQKIKKEFAKEAENNKITLNTILPDQPLIVNVDSDKIMQIFTNLVSNAIRFTSAGGEVVLSIKDDKDGILCSVSDTGIGIAKENLGKLFSKFEQFGRVEGPGYKGTGLGLAIAKGLVEKHGGKIWVESEIGEGTTFWFTLEKTAAPKILLVDDEPKIIDIVKGFLKNEKYQFVEAYDGNEAIEKARKEVLSLILLDMMLPGMNGYEVIGRLKQDIRTHDIPIIINSAYQVDESRLRKINENAVIPILRKPLEADLLNQKVKEMLAV
jgi:CheY-like chemotaxis protein